MTYEATRERLETYFDRTASRTWEALTSDAPVSRIRQTVREGRDAMRAELLSILPGDLAGARVLDAVVMLPPLSPPDKPTGQTTLVTRRLPRPPCNGVLTTPSTCGRRMVMASIRHGRRSGHSPPMLPPHHQQTYSPVAALLATPPPRFRGNIMTRTAMPRPK